MSGRRRLGTVLVVWALSAAVLGCGGSDTPTGGESDLDDPQFSVSVSDFSPATDCQGCHPQHYADWSGSMHAYAVKDPVWLAVRDLGQSAYANALAGACSPCHGTIGNRSGEISWGPIDQEAAAPVVTEGVGCDICHVISSLHGLSNAAFDITPGETKFGTIVNPIPTDAHESEYSSLYQESEYCGSCHDFILDNGTELEAVFREWLSGGFTLTGKTCNDCHMPTYEGPAALDGPIRTLHSHTMQGVDIALIDFPQKSEQFQLVQELLRNALTLEVDAGIMTDPGQEVDQVEIDARIINDQTGHNVPSGVPFNREMWLSVVVRDGSGSVIYSSGQLDENDDLMSIEADPDLFNAQATMLKADGTPTGATWEAADIENPSIKPGETRPVSYRFALPSQVEGPLTVDVVLRFRSFSPSLIRSLELSELLPIPIMDMAEVTRTIQLP